MRKSGDMIRDEVPILYLLFLWRKPTTFGRALTYSFHISVMCEVLNEDRNQDSEVKGACSEDCATEAPIQQT